MKKIRCIDYEKISDDLCVLGGLAILKFNVVLNHKNKDGKRTYFHSEVAYPSMKYGRRKTVINIKRQFSFFLSIETPSGNKQFKEFIYINPRDIIDVRMKLNSVFKWFSSKEYENLYIIKDDELVIMKKVQPIKIIRLAMDKYIEFEPIVCNTEYTKSMGVRMYLNGDSNYINIPIDSFLEFKYFIDSINMYQAALSLLSYIERPPYGTNMYTIQDNDEVVPPSETDNINKTKSAPRRININQSLNDKLGSL